MSYKKGGNAMFSMILEDLFEEMDEMELYSVNGGACTGGGCSSGSSSSGSSYSSGSCSSDCKNDSKSLSEKGCAGQKGFVFFDWGGNSASNRDGVYDHVEYCEFSSDGKTYTIYQNNGQTTPVATIYTTSKDSNGQGGVGTKAVFVPL